LRYLINCYALPAKNAALKNPIAALKKKQLGFYTSVFCKVRALIVGQNPFSQRKNLSNMGDARLLPTRRNTRRNRCPVTTSHMFHLGTAALCYRFRNRIATFSGAIATRPPGGAGAAPRIPGKGTYRSPYTEIFTQMVPLLCSGPRKKTLSKGSDAQWIPCSKQPPKVPMPDGRCDSA
jgi:hypothetical protein